MSFRRNDLRNCSRGGLGWSECNLISLSITSSEIQTSLRSISLPCLQGLVQEWSHNPVKANKNEGKFTKGFWKRSFLALQEGAIRTSLPGPEYCIVQTGGLKLKLSSTTEDETSDYKGAQLECIWHQHTYPQLQLDSFSYMTQETSFLLYSRLCWNFCFWRPKIWYLIYTKGSFGILKITNEGQVLGLKLCNVTDEENRSYTHTDIFIHVKRDIWLCNRMWQETAGHLIHWPLT